MSALPQSVSGSAPARIGIAENTCDRLLVGEHDARIARHSFNQTPLHCGFELNE
jgi:hypothetical protein